jgi:hypothetical protein
MMVIVFEFELPDFGSATDATSAAFNPTLLHIAKITYDASIQVKEDSGKKPINVGGSR